MDTPFMEAIAGGLAEQSFSTVRFEFPYMAKRRQDGKKRGPDPERVLLSTWRSVIELFEGRRLIIGGKSLGGRMASMLADQSGVSGLVCLGYPFHPPGKPERTRTAHLMTLKIPALILQGTRDPFGSPEDIRGYCLPDNIEVQWIEDGEHSFIPRKKSGRTESQNLAGAVQSIATFIGELVRDLE